MNRLTRSATNLAIAFLVLLVAALPLAQGEVVPSANAVCFNIFSTECEDQSKVVYCNSNDPSSSKYCSIDRGTDMVKDGVRDIQTQDKASVYLQKVVSYLLWFLWIIGVLYLIFAGFTIMTSSGDDEKVKKAKGTVKFVLAGLILIFLAYSIIRFVIGVINGSGAPAAGSGATFRFPSLIPTAYAATAVEDIAIAGTFLEYKKSIDAIAIDLDRQYKVDGKIQDATLLRLKALVVGTMDTVPDKYASSNATMAQSVVTAIEVVRKDPGSDSKISEMASVLSSYLKGAKIDSISGKASATPASGNAPLTVSLRADNVRDPSGVVVPARNYVWWVKKTSGREIIGTGPSIAYTFREERNYTVFLDVLSASRNSNGKTDVLPLQTSVEVQVLPKLGNILLFLNGTNVSNSEKHKITPSTGRAGLVIDASASQANGGATIVRTEWDFGNGVVAAYDGAPRLERQTYLEGTYRIKLKLTTNEKQSVIKELDLQVMDPMATIRADRSEGYANEEFKFQANPNLGGTPLTYEWNILEADGGKVLFTSKVSTANYKFPRMGRYVVRLKTMTPSGKQDVDSLGITINSKDPVPLFDLRNSGQESPNTVIFDATKSYDPDSMEASKLTFSWNVDGERVELADSSRNGAIGRYTFSTLGTHKIALEITNEQGKTATLRKDIDITSLLSVKLSMTPKIASLWTPVHFIAESKEANVFEWSFWDDSSPEITSDGRASHTYKKSGTYDVRLTVRGTNWGGQNTITRKVYVTEANSPFALIGIKIDSEFVQISPDACNGKEAFVINRVKPVQFTAEESVNVDGTNSGLSYSWKYANKTSTQRDFTYKFDELGCFPVSLTVRSQKSGKIHSTQAYVKVENVLPTFSSLSITPEKTDADPVVVKVTANNAADDDGVITSYLWYYYTDSDPEPQDFRITRTPATAFVLPRINGKYYFAVTMEDSNGEKVNSDQQREDRYSLTLASDNINTPLITLKVDHSNVNAGEKVKFDAIVKNVLQNDISQKTEYKWDFDGDGFYEESGNSATITHVYDKPGVFNMKVKATYKGISNTKYQTISVKNDLRPNAEYIAIGRKFVFLNTTPGIYQSAKWNLGNGIVSSNNRDFFTYEFSETDDLSSMSVRLDVSDGKDSKYVEIPLRKDVVNEARLGRSEEKAIYFTYPRASGGVIEVENPEDNVFVYLGESKDSPVKYVIDTDIDLDSDLNGDTSDDADNKGTESYLSGAPYVIKNLSKGRKNRTIRITTYDASGKKIESQDVKIVVAYLKDAIESPENEGKVPEGISDSEKADIEKLKDIIRTKTPEQDRLKLMQMLSALQENWFDQREKTKIILDMEGVLSEIKIDQTIRDEAYSLLEGFLVADSQTKDEIALAVKVLKSLIPESNDHYAEIIGESGKPGLVDEILSHPTNTELNREIGKKILDYVKNDSGIENKDKLIIKSQLEVIIYGGQANVPTSSKDPSADDEEQTGIMSFILSVGKGIGILIILIIGGFVALFAFFKVSNRNPSLGFQDFLIERIFGGKHESSNPSSQAQTPTPSVKNVETAPKIAESTEKASMPVETSKPAYVDPLAFATASTVSQDTLSTTEPSSIETSSMETKVTPDEPSFIPSADAEVALPAWLKGSSLDPSSVSVSEPALENATELPTEPVLQESVLQESVLQESASPEPVFQESLPQEPSVSPMAQISDDLPDWLKGMDVTAVEKEVESELSETKEPSSQSFEPSSQSFEPSSQSFEPSSESVETESVETEMLSDIESMEKPTPSSEDLPDWLKSSIVTTGTPEAKEMTSEEKSEKKPKRGSKKPQSEESKNDETPPVAPPSDDLPDWLKP